MFTCTVLIIPSSDHERTIVDQPAIKVASSDLVKAVISELKAAQTNCFQPLENKAMLLTMLESMQALNLNHCQLGDSEMQTLSEILKTNRTLTSIDLSHNNISREGVRVLEFGLLGNISLTALNLQANPVSNHSWNEYTRAELEEYMLNAIALEAIDNRLVRNQILKKIGTRSVVFK